MRYAHRHRFLFASLIVVVLGLLIGNWSFAQGDPPPPEAVTIPGVVTKMLNGVSTTDLQGTFFPAPVNGGTLHPAILMLPQLTDMSSGGTIVSDRTLLEPIALAFQAQGFHVLTVNLDGYFWGGGQSPTMVEGLQDVQAAYEWLASRADVDPERVAVLGSSIGANYALLLMEAIPSIPVGLIFSPAQDYGGLMPNPSVLTDRVVQVYAGTDEAADPAYLSWLEQYASLSIPAPGHGTFIFSNPALLGDEMNIWLELFRLRADVEAGNITPIQAWAIFLDLMYDYFGMFCPAPPLIVLGGGLLFRRKRRTK